MEFPVPVLCLFTRQDACLEVIIGLREIIYFYILPLSVKQLLFTHIELITLPVL